MSKQRLSEKVTEHLSGCVLEPAANAVRRSFRGQSLEQRQHERRQRLMQAGMQCYGTHGFFAVTVRDICAEARLTERYFYESFKNSELLFKAIYLAQIEQLQATIVQQTLAFAGQPNVQILNSLKALLDFLQADPRSARILFVDAPLVHELHGGTVQEAVATFDRLIMNWLLAVAPSLAERQRELSLIATGLNGYVIHLAMRWVSNGFRESHEEVLAACTLVYTSIFQNLGVLPAST